MKTCSQLIVAVMFGLLLLSATSLMAVGIDELQRNFDQPPDDSRIMMRWWWFGPAVTKPELEREMKLMKAGGIGGFEVQPTYPLSLDDEKAGINNLKFMSPEFLEALAFAAEKAKQLGLRMDLTLGSGWPYGGAQFSVDEAAGALYVENVPHQTGIQERSLAAYLRGRENNRGLYRSAEKKQTRRTSG